MDIFWEIQFSYLCVEIYAGLRFLSELEDEARFEAIWKYHQQLVIHNLKELKDINHLLSQWIDQPKPLLYITNIRVRYPEQTWR